MSNPIAALDVEGPGRILARLAEEAHLGHIGRLMAPFREVDVIDVSRIRSRSSAQEYRVRNASYGRQLADRLARMNLQWQAEWVQGIDLCWDSEDWAAPPSSLDSMHPGTILVVNYGDYKGSWTKLKGKGFVNADGRKVYSHLLEKAKVTK